VAAGGGSILHFDGARFRVGSDSAGANPGPKCYRRGGPLAVTDANVMVGKLIPDFFPKIFGPRQEEPLDADAVREGFAALAERIGDGRTGEEVADGFIRIAVENMANAIKKISPARRGRYALNCSAAPSTPAQRCRRLGMAERAHSSVLVAPLRLWNGPRRHSQRAPAGNRKAVR
jgi:5-oxoprolinase (ATP-hydrolysing)